VKIISISLALVGVLLFTLSLTIMESYSPIQILGMSVGVFLFFFSFMLVTQTQK